MQTQTHKLSRRIIQDKQKRKMSQRSSENLYQI